MPFLIEPVMAKFVVVATERSTRWRTPPPDSPKVDGARVQSDDQFAVAVTGDPSLGTFELRLTANAE